MNGAELLVNKLTHAGVKQIFALSGNQIMPIFDACIDSEIKIIHVRHEAAAVFMAEAYAQLSGEIGVALVTAGAGIANALGPMFTSVHSQSPVLILSGDSPIKQDTMGSFQEMDQVSMTAALTKYSARPTTIDELSLFTEKAIDIAKDGKMGPVHLALADDLLRDPFDEAKLTIISNQISHPVNLEPSQFDAIKKIILNAENPLIILGPSLNDTRMPGISVQLEQNLQAPIVTMESPRGLNDPALGDICGVFNQADLIVLFGKSIDFTVGFGSKNITKPNAKWIVFNNCDDEIKRANKNIGDLLISAVNASPYDCAKYFIASGKNEKNTLNESRSVWIDFVKCSLEKRSYVLDENITSGSINSLQLCSAVQKQIEKYNDSVVICDGGEFGQWAQAVTRGTRRIVNGVSGAIGGGICYAIAAQKFAPAAKIFALMGDGTCGFHFMEFETAVREGIPFVAIIGNDLKWNAEHQIQLRDYGEDRLSNCQLSDARYDLAAKALGAHGEFVTDLAELNSALESAIKSNKPACVNVMIEGFSAPKRP